MISIQPPLFEGLAHVHFEEPPSHRAEPFLRSNKRSRWIFSCPRANTEPGTTYDNLPVLNWETSTHSCRSEQTMNHIGSQSNAPKIPIDDGAYTRRMEDYILLLLCPRTRYCLDVMETMTDFTLPLGRCPYDSLHFFFK